ncbi:MAG: MFS transporter [Candidatus Hodarchaeales archaeon]|jgi:MFS family permease
MKISGLMISVSLFSFLSFLRRAIFYAFFYVYLRSFLGLSNTLSALLGTANLATSTVGQLKLWGPRLNRNPHLAKKYVVRGEVIAGVVYLIAFLGHRIFVNSNSNLIAALFLISCTSFLEIFWSGSDLGIRQLQAEATIGENRGRLVGTIDGIGLIGQLLGFLIGGILYQEGNGFFNGSIFYVVVVLIFACAFVIFIAPYDSEFKESDSLILTTGGIKEVFKLPTFGYFIIILGILTMGISASTQLFLYYVTDQSALNFSDEVLSYLLILFSLSGGLIAPIGGKLSDFWGRIPIMIISGFSAALSYFAFFSLGQQPLLIIAFIYSVLGASSAILQSIAFSHAADLLPQEFQGTGFGVFNVTLATGWGLAGFLIGGPISDVLISFGESTASAYRSSFLVSGLIILFGTVALLSVKRK